MPHQWRADERLARWNEPGYPDDFQVLFLNPDSARGSQHEVMWVRVTAFDSTTDEFLAVLLNAPQVLSSVQQGDNVAFRVRRDGYLVAVGTPDYPGAGWPPPTAFQSAVLRPGVRAYRVAGNGNDMSAIDRCVAILRPAMRDASLRASTRERFIGHFLLGRCYAELYDTDSAIAQFRAAIRLDSTDLDSHMALLAELSVKSHHPPGTMLTPALLQWDSAYVNELHYVRAHFATDPDVSRLLSSVFDAHSNGADTLSPAERQRLDRVGYAVFRWKRR
jgi:hypothetical protein